MKSFTLSGLFHTLTDILKPENRWRIKRWFKHHYTLWSISTKAKWVRFYVMRRKAVKPARKFIITLVDMPLSVKAAQRCMESAVKHGEDQNLEIMAAVDRLHSEAFFKEHGIKPMRKHLYRKPGLKVDRLATMGCFASHYKLWLHCVKIGEPIIVLEHNAVFAAPVPAIRLKHVAALEAPAWGYFAGGWISDAISSVSAESYHPGEHLYGSKAYAVTPDGAKRLMNGARRGTEVKPADCFIDKKLVEIILYSCPPVTHIEDFSSIC